MTDIRDKKTFLVALRICVSGGYEKITHQLIEADDVEQAEQLAFQGESHNEEAGWDDSLASWEDDGMLYRVADIKEVPWDDAVTLRKYF